MMPLFEKGVSWRRMDRILRSWEGTPYKHCGIWKGRGVDCITFVAQALLEYGVLRKIAYRYYPRTWYHLDDELLLDAVVEHIRGHMKPDYRISEVAGSEWASWTPLLPASGLRPGDLLFINACLSGRTNHSGILLRDGREASMIHCSTGRGVHIAQFNEAWRRRLKKVFRVYC